MTNTFNAQQKSSFNLSGIVSYDDKNRVVEIKFDCDLPREIRDELCNSCFFWDGVVRCWYAKQNSLTLEVAGKYQQIFSS